MALLSYSVHHLDHGIAAVEQVSPAAEGLATRLTSDGMLRGALILSTCNRFEIYLDTGDLPDEQVYPLVRNAISDRLAEMGHAELPQDLQLTCRSASAAIRHIFRVSAGLDSMVIGEREVAGQLRKALKFGRSAGTMSQLLDTVIEQALRCSRRIFTSTELSGRGRSLVATGLDLAMTAMVSPPEDSRVLLIGTGAYAGATVQALSSRGFTSVEVFSRSGRAAQFAATRDLQVTDQLPSAIARCDLVVCCSGTGGHVLDQTLVGTALEQDRNGDLVLLDLALRRDIEPEVALLPGVTMWALPDIQQQLGSLGREQVSEAEELIDQAIRELAATMRGRQMDPAVLALRQLVASMVDDEVNRLPGAMVPSDTAAHALRRLAARLIHVPMVRARKAAGEGRIDDFMSALSELWDISVEPGLPLLTDDELLDPDEIEHAVCPATGFTLADLTMRPRLEAI